MCRKDTEMFCVRSAILYQGHITTLSVLSFIRNTRGKKMEDQSNLIKVANRNKDNLYPNILKSSNAKGNLKIL